MAGPSFEVCKLNVLGMLLLVLPLPARSQVKFEAVKGTTVVINVLQDEVIVAADSRGTIGPGKYGDDDCKIAAFGGKIVFATAGLRHIRLSDRVTSKVWDSHEIAAKSFKSVIAKPDSKNEDVVAAVARGWEVRAKRYFLSAMKLTSPQDLLKLTGQPIISEGVFIGKNPDGNFSVIHVSVGVNPAVPTIMTSSKRLIPESMNFMGFSTVALEFYTKSSQRARVEVKKWHSTLKAKDPKEVQEMLVPQLVRWSVFYRSPKDDVGGDVDTLVFGPDGIKWPNRKGNCKAQE